ncbi:MAG: cytidylate kinase [Desulfobacterales bacterium CG23_combo_of_CG06-09_8_20_14_all_51_8]|nr:MAG: cytidylate kinase [Desulfobacterales bacterium CG23_combo_of_CG06-09_8_20_14_all_51_8]
MKKLLITIDGPAGAGKTTVSRALAERLQYRYIDTGALYRGVALEARENGIPPEDDQGLEALCKGLELAFIRNENGVRLYSGETDISDAIRTPEMSMMASAVSARMVVRKALLDIQRRMGAEKGAVFEGRDMGTVVFPDADVKFFLTADLNVRAIRRHRELEEKQAAQKFEEVEKDMALRDAADSSRALAPLKPAQDAVFIDSTEISAQSVIDQMMKHIRKKIDDAA